MPRVSVIIPIGDLTYYEDCIRSVFTQTVKDYEIITIEDYGLRGPSWARNQGLKDATGEWVMFLDADDKLRPRAIETLLSHTNDMVVGDFVKVKGCCVTPSDHHRYFEGETVLFKDGILDYVKAYLRTQYRHTLFMHNWGRLYRRSIIEKHNIRFDERLKTLEDIPFNFEFLQHAESVTYIPEVIYEHRIHDQSQGTTVAETPDFGEMISHAFTPVSNFLKPKAYYTLSHCITSHMVTILIRGCRKFKWWEVVKAYKFVRAVVDDPVVRYNLDYYNPILPDNRIIPMFMKQRNILAIILVARRVYR